jgi:hypothetical protein
MRHANLPLQVLAPSVAFAPSKQLARFLWRRICTLATARLAPLVHRRGTGFCACCTEIAPLTILARILLSFAFLFSRSAAVAAGGGHRWLHPHQ